MSAVFPEDFLFKIENKRKEKQKQREEGKE